MSSDLLTWLLGVCVVVFISACWGVPRLFRLVRLVVSRVWALAPTRRQPWRQ